VHSFGGIQADDCVVSLHMNDSEFLGGAFLVFHEEDEEEDGSRG